MLTQTLATGRVVPAFKVLSESVNIPKNHIDIHIHGDVIAKIADFLKSFFIDSVRKDIEKSMNDALKTEIAPQINEIMANAKGTAEVFPKSDLDWSLAKTPIINSKSLEFGVKGLIFPKAGPEVEPKVQPPVMPYHDDAAKSEFQLFLSNYVVDSAAATFLETQGLHFWTYAKDVPKNFLIQLTTSGLNMFFPGME